MHYSSTVSLARFHSRQYLNSLLSLKHMWQRLVPMADIFISYASEDRERARLLAAVLEQHGWSVWWDRKIPVGKSFHQIIEEAIDQARCVVVIWSKYSVSSDWVRNEAEEGKRKNILAPVLLDDARIPLGFRHIQAANLSHWQPAQPSFEFDGLLDSIKAITVAPGAALVSEQGERKIARKSSAQPQADAQPIGDDLLGTPQSGLAPKPDAPDQGSDIATKAKPRRFRKTVAALAGIAVLAGLAVVVSNMQSERPGLSSASEGVATESTREEAMEEEGLSSNDGAEIPTTPAAASEPISASQLVKGSAGDDTSDSILVVREDNLLGGWILERRVEGSVRTMHVWIEQRGSDVELYTADDYG